jgi:excisionase family DNA binding protein
MSKSLSATFTRASAGRGAAPKNQVELQNPGVTVSGSAPSSQLSGAPRHIAAGRRLAAVLSASQAASSTTAAEAPTGLPAPAEAALASPILTVDELAALLRLNRKTVYEALSRGEIPGARRVGSSYRILRAAVIEWLASGQGRVSHSKRLK